MFLFDIVFQTNEYYGDSGSFSDDLKVELAGAALGAIVTVGLFVWALRNEKGKELKGKEELENERLIYLQHLIQGSEQFVSALIGGLNDFEEAFKKDKMVIPLLNSSSSNDLQRVVNHIDRAPYFHAYRNRIGGRGILVLFGLLDYFEGVRVEIESLLRKAKQHDFERKVEFKENLDQLVLLIRKHNRELRDKGLVNTPEYRILNSRIHALNEILEKNPADYQSMASRVAMPIIKFYVDNTTRGYSVEFMEIADLASGVIKLPSPIILNNSKLASSFAEYSKDMNEHLVRLKQEFQSLDDYCNGISPAQD